VGRHPDDVAGEFGRFMKLAPQAAQKRSTQGGANGAADGHKSEDEVPTHPTLEPPSNPHGLAIMMLSRVSCG
jgi:hypothetical protein